MNKIIAYLQNLFRLYQTNRLYSLVRDLDVYGGLMDRAAFVKKLKQAIRLAEKRKEWIEESIWNTLNFPPIEALITLEKQIKKDLDTAERGGSAKNDDQFWNQGRLDCLLEIKDIMKKNYGDSDSRTSPGKTPYLE